MTILDDTDTRIVGFQSLNALTAEQRTKLWRRISGQLRQDVAGRLSPLTKAGPQNTQSTAWVEADASRALRLAFSRTASNVRPQRPDFNVRGLQKWEGRITSLEDTLFTAELKPLTHSGPAVLADFSVDLLDPEDKAEPGDVVYVTVRTVTDHRGRRPTMTSSVRLRRTGNWTDEDVERLDSSARQEWAEVAKYAD